MRSALPFVRCRKGKFSLRQPYTAWLRQFAGPPQMLGWKMPKQTRDSIPALVLAVIAQVYELAGHRTQPWYVDRSALDLVDATDGGFFDLLRRGERVAGGRWRTSEERCDNGRRCTAAGGVRADLSERSMAMRRQG